MGLPGSFEFLSQLSSPLSKLPQDAPTQAGLLLGIFLIALLPLLFERSRAVLGWIGGRFGSAFTRLSALTAWLIDRTIPLNTRDDTPSASWLALWVLVNLGIVGGTLGIHHLPPAWAPFAVGLLAGIFLLNTLFLCGAYCAMNEENALWRRRIRMASRLFGHRYDRLNLSTARNAWIVGASVPLFVLQLAALAMWAQHQHGLHTVTVRESVGVPLLDFAIAILGSTPLVFPMAVVGLSSKILVVGALKVAVGFFASSIVGVAVYGFIKRHSACRRLIADLLRRTDPGGFAALEEQVRMGPTLLKRFIVVAYNEAEDDPETGTTADALRSKLLRLATEIKPMYSAPAMFLRSYSRCGAEFQKEGTERVVAFLTQRKDFDEPALKATVNAVIAARNRGALPLVSDLENAGRILTGALRRLLAMTQEKPEIARNVETFLAAKPVQECLTAALGSDANPVGDKMRDYWRPHIDIAVRHLQGELRVRDVPRLLRMLRHASPAIAVAASDAATTLMSRANNAGARDLDSVVETIDWLRHQPGLDAALQASLARLRREALRLQRRNPVQKAA